MDDYLVKGVQVHSFSDQSGCVFLELHSGETLSVLMSEADIVRALSGEMKLDDTDEKSLAIKSLLQKNILISSNKKNADV